VTSRILSGRGVREGRCRSAAIRPPIDNSWEATRRHLDPSPNPGVSSWIKLVFVVPDASHLDVTAADTMGVAVFVGRLAAMMVRAFIDDASGRTAQQEQQSNQLVHSILAVRDTSSTVTGG
jgi:hypothetical protein